MPHFSKSWQRPIAVLAVAAGSAAGAWLLGHARFVRTLHLKAGDLQFLARGAIAAPNVVLLAIDARTLHTIPELQLFWHPYYAAAIRAAADAGARVMALDIAFAVPVEKWEPGHDALLAEAVAAAAPRMPVVCGYNPALLARQRDWPVPVNMLAAAMDLAGYTNLTVDGDDFVRRQELLEPPVPGAAVPAARSLALRVAERYLGAPARFENGRLWLAGRPLAREILINHAGPPGTVPRVSLADFLAAARAGRMDHLRHWVSGKAVLLGADNVEDRHPTPFYSPLRGPRWNTAGVEIHASTLNTLLERRYLTPAPPWLPPTAMFGGAALAAAAVLALAPGAAALACAGLAFAVALLTHLAFRAGWVVSASGILLACLLAATAALGLRALRAERLGRLFAAAVSLFVGRRVAESLAETESLAMAGAEHFVTVLFTDIRGFTAFCEGRPPGEVVELLNGYFSGLVSLVVAHRGHVNKFIGDGMLAVFSDLDGAAPGDHALRAVRCGMAAAAAPGRFETGVGLHSGKVILGNVGSPDKLEYTVLGDTVNVASRIESMNKEFHTRLLFSEATRALLGDALPVREAGAAVLRGQSKPVILYTVAPQSVRKWEV